MNRREALRQITLSGVAMVASEAANNAAPLVPATPDTVAPPPFHSSPRHDMRNYAIPAKRTHIAILTYPGSSILEIASLQQFLSRMGNAEIHLVWKSKDPISTDTDVTIVPTEKYSELEDDMDVILVPGGSNGVADVMVDAEAIAFLRNKATKASYITSTGSGSLILAAAGLLSGYKATGHWMTRDILKSLGALPINKRICKDHNRITGAGSTAAIDFALYLTNTMRNANMAAALQLANEYAPQPIANAGLPETAPIAVTKMEWAMNAALRDELHDTAVKIKSGKK